MTSSYPAGADTYPTHVTDDLITAADVNHIQESLTAIEGTLGLSPAGGSGTVAARLTAVDAALAAAPAAYAPISAATAWQLLPGTRPAPVAKTFTTFQAGHGYANNAGGSANLNDTADYVIGFQAVSAVTSGAGAGTVKTIKRTGFTAVNATGLSPVVWVKVDDDTHLASLILYLGDTALANNYQWELKSTAGDVWLKPGIWHRITLSWGDVTTIQGTPTRSAITDAQFRIADDAGGAVTVHFNGIALVPEPTAWPNGVVSLSFDDTYLSHFTQVKPKLDQYGYAATAYVIQDAVGTAGFMTLAQLHGLEDASGWEVCGHSTTGALHNARLTSLTPTQLEAEFAAQRAFLNTNGFRGTSTAYPGGVYDTNVVAAVEKFYPAARLVFQRSETLPPARRSKLRSRILLANSLGTGAITAAIDQAYTNREWLILTGHDVNATAPVSTDYTIANLGTVVDYLATKGIPVRTVGEVLATKP